MRSWFFRLFALAAIFILTILNLSLQVFEDSSGFWVAKAIPANIPLFNLLILNTGQAVIAIFLASDFLKRDKKLDTSEVFYVRPLSNAAYVMGKIWGNLRVFLVLNLVVMGISVLFTFASPNGVVDWMAYPLYFFLLCVPTLVYIIGLSVFLMMVLKNQAITFVLLLGYIGLTLFYLSNKFYYLFDYMSFFLPVVQSTITGFTNLEAILTHRAIYLFAGLACIFVTIPMFRRLPSSPRSAYLWGGLAAVMLLLCGAAGYRHVDSLMQAGRLRTGYIAVNNAYTHHPQMVITHYDIHLKQHPRSLTSQVQMKGVALAASEVFAFCLNPGLTVEAVEEGSRPLTFTRDKQMLLVHFGREIAQGDSANFTIAYGGRIDPAFCYLDVPDELLQKERSIAMFSFDKQYVFQTDNYHLYTPETYWYPRPGTSYSSESADWQQTYFSHFRLHVLALPGLVPLAQGEGVEADDGSYAFVPEYPMQALSLAIGRYRPLSVTADSVRYTFWYIEGNDVFSSHLHDIRDTIPSLIHNFRENLERTYKLTYPFRRFSLIETPAPFYSYPHTWSQAEEVMQPEILFFPERGWLNESFDLWKREKREMTWAARNGESINEAEAKIRAFNRLLSLLSQPEGAYNYESGERDTYTITVPPNPYFVYPQLFNFRYNVFSPERTAANRVVEVYLQGNATGQTERERDVNGISNLEKASLLMEKQSFSALLADSSLRELSGRLAYLKAARLFAPAEVSMGIAAFRDSLYALLERNTFRNLSFEQLLDELGGISQTNLLAGLDEWDKPVTLPLYDVSPPELSKYTNRGQETYVLKINLSNRSATNGFIRLQIEDDRRGNETNDPRLNRTISIDAHQRKQLITVWDNAPRRLTIQTGLSGNLPNEIQYTLSDLRQERGAAPDTEGDYSEADTFRENPGEVIVDNEDPQLFALSHAPAMGLLPKWLDKPRDASFQYTGMGGQLPRAWANTINAGYYGTQIRSAYLVRSGSGTQTATWKIPVPSPGHYDVYYYMYKNNRQRNNRQDAEYHFRILYDDETEDAYINLERADNGWESLGAYYFASDTVRIVLSNESTARSVTADAVRIVKK
jgi:hypothetical protein